MNILVLRKNLMIFLGTTLVSLVLLGFAGYFIVNSTTFGEDGAARTLSGNCLSLLRSNGFSSTSTQNGEFALYHASTRDVERSVFKAAASIARCYGYTLKQFCAGTGCQKPGVTFVLTPSKESK